MSTRLRPWCTTASTTFGTVNLPASVFPEAIVQDIGHGVIKDGPARIELDPIYLDCVTISEENPMTVFLQFTAPPAQHYIEKGTTGFEVIVTDGVVQNATFDYSVPATKKGAEKTRFPTPARRPTVSLTE